MTPVSFPFLRLAAAVAIYALGLALFVVLRLDPVARVDRKVTFDLQRWALDRPPTATMA
ncbi:MAG: hypothetical protein ACFCVK_01200 [Acidimicrobiales bacterium]